MQMGFGAGRPQSPDNMSLRTTTICESCERAFDPALEFEGLRFELAFLEVRANEVERLDLNPELVGFDQDYYRRIKSLVERFERCQDESMPCAQCATGERRRPR